MINQKNSYFDGSLLSYISWLVLGAFVSFLTIGLAYPWAITNIYRWKTKHTVIDGKRLQFTGSAWGLFGQWIKWCFLVIITLGIYSFWIPIKLLEWKTEHTQFEEEFYDF